MLVIVGTIIVFGAVAGGYLMAGGHFAVLFQPNEFVIILGAAIGAFIIGNTKTNLKAVGAGMKRALKGPTYKKQDYVELLSLLYQLFRLAKTKGMLALEQHVEKPDESTLFAQFPNVQKNHHAVEFLCDYLRMMTLGTENANEVETLIDAELEAHHAEQHNAAHAVQLMADGMPALGIVAAVLGVIHTMGSITEPPEVLGHLIGGALARTLPGGFLSYGVVGPTASAIKDRADTELKYFLCMKTCVLAFLQGAAPQVA